MVRAARNGLFSSDHLHFAKPMVFVAARTKAFTTARPPDFPAKRNSACPVVLHHREHRVGFAHHQETSTNTAHSTIQHQRQARAGPIAIAMLPTAAAAQHHHAQHHSGPFPAPGSHRSSAGDQLPGLQPARLPKEVIGFCGTWRCDIGAKALRGP